MKCKINCKAKVSKCTSSNAAPAKKHARIHATCVCMDTHAYARERVLVYRNLSEIDLHL